MILQDFDHLVTTGNSDSSRRNAARDGHDDL